MSCALRVVRRMRRPSFMVGTSTNGSSVTLTTESFQLMFTMTRIRKKAEKICRSQSASMLETESWIFSMSFMMDDMIWPVDWSSKKWASWRST